ncbi:MAG TPA: hypothetical protein VLL50_14995 [Usitatibacter sp.]|nr:hypothetical protein [Usitatibacter sp.]
MHPKSAAAPTGAEWARDGLSTVTRAPIPGADADLPHVLTPDQVMREGKQPPGERVLVYDAEGYYMGASLAERFAREGKLTTVSVEDPQGGRR